VRPQGVTGAPTLTTRFGPSGPGPLASFSLALAGLAAAIRLCDSPHSEKQRLCEPHCCHQDQQQTEQRKEPGRLHSQR